MVEQKNDSLVRQYLGYDRLETQEHLALVNALYERMWLSYNLFQPVLHLKEKQVQQHKVKRKWDTAQTPYERLKVTGILSVEAQARLQDVYEQTNPLALRQEIYDRLAVIWETRTPQQVPTSSPVLVET